MNETTYKTESDIVAFNPEDVQAYFQILAKGFHTGKLTFNQVREALKDIMLYDDNAVLWTIGAGSGEWHRREGDTWVKGTPVGPLYSAYRVLHALGNLSRECPSCRNQVPHDYRFCPNCGGPMELTIRKEADSGPSETTEQKPVYCRKCGKPVQPSAKFCTSCGTPRRQ